MFTLTEKGQEMLDVSTHTSQRHGGPEHRYWVRSLAEQLKTEGYEVAEEVSLGAGKTVDLVASRDGKRIAYEVETGASDVSGNIRKCRDAGFDEILVVFISQKAREKSERISVAANSVHLVTAAELCPSALGAERPASAVPGSRRT